MHRIESITSQLLPGRWNQFVIHANLSILFVLCYLQGCKMVNRAVAQTKSLTETQTNTFMNIRGLRFCHPFSNKKETFSLALPFDNQHYAALLGFFKECLLGFHQTFLLEFLWVFPRNLSRTVPDLSTGTLTMDFFLMATNVASLFFAYFHKQTGERWRSHSPFLSSRSFLCLFSEQKKSLATPGMHSTWSLLKLILLKFLREFFQVLFQRFFLKFLLELSKDSSGDLERI